MRLQINAGDKYGMLTVLKEVEAAKLPSGQRNRQMLCQCECGNEKVVRVLHLTRLRIISCGCLGGESHGQSVSPLYNVWRGMKNRCNTDTCIDSHRYKDRGIEVCTEWSSSFISFRNWALENGFKPGLQIDRIDNDKGYYPDNCRFVSNIVNVNNREVTLFVYYDNKIVSLSLLLREKNLFENYAAIYGRLKRGWRPKKAIDTPIRKGNYSKKYSGSDQTGAKGIQCLDT